MLQPGTRVRVKSFTDIEKTLDTNNYCDCIWFAPPMKTFCEREFKIKTRSGEDFVYILDDIPWDWHEKWFDVMDESTNYLNDGSIEQRSLCLALIRQTMSSNTPDIAVLKGLNKGNYESGAFPDSLKGGFYYRNYPQDRWIPSKKIAENIPNWPCLKLKPEILEKTIRSCLKQHSLEYFKEQVAKPILIWFIFSKTIEGDEYWSAVHEQTISQATVKDNTSEESNNITIINNKENEIEFQRKKGSIFRGTVPEGNQQSSGKCKTATCSGYICYQVCTGR